MKTILFQGDSITDCRRFTEPEEADTQRTYAFGTGYPFQVASELAYRYPGEYRFVNRGISGNRVVDLYARMKKDILNHRPDYLSILLGINDVWHEIMHENGVNPEKFEKVYRMLLDEVLEELPNIKILLFTPFFLPGSATVQEEHPEVFAFFSTEVPKYEAAVLRIAEDYKLPVVRTQPLFDEAAKILPAEHLLHDGVHPGLGGNYILSREFIKWFESVK